MLEKKHINPVFFNYSYEQIIRKGGAQGEEIARVLGKKAEKKTFKKRREDKGGE